MATSGIVFVFCLYYVLLCLDIQTRIIDIVQAISVQFPQQFEVATSCLLPSHTQILAEALMTSSTHSN